MSVYTLGDFARATGGKLINGSEDIAFEGLVIDSRKVREGLGFAALRGERTDGHEYISTAFESGASFCLVDTMPSNETRPIIVCDDVPSALLSAAEDYRKSLNVPVIGVTGSAGKTTAKEMIASVLARQYATHKTEKNFNNELGVPLTLFELKPKHEVSVVELGISGFGEMRKLSKAAKPNMAVFTLIGRAHLEQLGDLDGVLRAKAEMLEHMHEDSVLILNGDDERLRGIECKQKKVLCGISAHNDIYADNINIRSDGGCDFRVIYAGGTFTLSTSAYGKHLVYAALFATAVGLSLGLSEVEITEGVRAYEPVGRRASLADLGHIRLIDDCYNANPDSMLSAIDSATLLGGSLVCVLGDMFELGEDTERLHREVGDYARKVGALLFTSGELARSMGGEHYESESELLTALEAVLKEGDTVLVKASRSMEFEKISEGIKRMKI